MMTQRQIRFGLLACALVALAPAAARAIGLNEWQLTTNGNWSDAARWNGTDVPGSTSHTDDDVEIRSGFTPTVTLDNNSLAAMTGTPSALTIQSLAIGSRTVDGDATNSRGNLNVDDTGGSRFVWHMGGLLKQQNASILTAVNVDLDFASSLTGVLMQGGGGNGTFDFTDSTITVNLSAGSNAGEFLFRDNTVLKMTGQATGSSAATSTLTWKNNDGTAAIAARQTGTGGVTLGPAGAIIELTNTVLDVDQIGAGRSATSHFILDNSGITGVGNASTIGQLNVLDNSVGSEIRGGDVEIGRVFFERTNTGSTELTVTGGNVTVTNDVLMNSNATNKTSLGRFQLLEVDGGSLSVGGDLIVGYQTDNASDAKGNTEVRLTSGSLNVDGRMILGRLTAFGNSQRSPGTFVMTGGTLTADDVEIGRRAGGADGGSGYWDQTGGDATISGTMTLLQSNSLGEGTYGARELTVAGSSTLTFTGPGMAIGTGTDFSLLTTVDLSGTIIVNPISTTTPTLLAFDDDLGGAFDSEDDINTFFAAGNGVGTLDLNGLNGSEVLTVTPSGNVATNAMYINALVGLSASEVLSLLDSPINLYYNPANSPLLLSQTFDLNGGGTLQPLTLPLQVPEPCNGLLLVAGAVALLARRRARRT